jgi:TIR domain
VATRVLFNKRDWYDVVEEQAASFKTAYEALPDDQALDEAAIGELKARFMLHVPTLLRDKMEYDEVETDRHRLGKHNMAVRMASQAQGQSATEFVFCIPFDGDPAVFDIAPSAMNGDVAQGEISGDQVVIRLQPLPGYDVKGHVDRELGKIDWRLNHLRGGLMHLDEQLNIARAWCMQTRRAAIEARSKINRDFGVPRRQPQLISVPAAPAKPVAVQRPVLSEKPAPETWDVFMSHASPDKPWVKGLVRALREADVTVWFDEDYLEWGENLQRGINRGLINSRKAIAVLSKSYLAERKWTEAEISGLLAREKLGETLILPIWHQITEDDLKLYNLVLASRIGKVSDSDNYSEIVRAVLKALGRSAEARSTASATPPLSQEGLNVANVTYYGPKGERPMMIVKLAADREGWFILRYIDGSVEEGTLSDIAIKYAMADKKLTMNGYKQTNVSGGSLYPDFNL